MLCYKNTDNIRELGDSKKDFSSGRGNIEFLKKYFQMLRLEGNEVCETWKTVAT
jgi:hypothetical protein